ncbi:flavodoxin [Peribacillus simplex]|uniref:flavodoxin domain-containing protein n=1 Tax=Peribacillus simplex TaxID=1478 RepID=UPI000F63F69A|nr:flavodoxin domain-containing protein [Peribacillus simplex]RRN72281.1 flavodoxin [Peribacillus simplex]
MSYKVAIVYHSAGGNTKALAEAIGSLLPGAGLYQLHEFDLDTLPDYDALIVGTYTWGNGELPAKSAALYKELEQLPIAHLKTGVFGTGETNYNHFCGAVDHFRDMLFAKSQLAVTLKIEQMYQESDLPRLQKFASLFQN